MNTFKNFMIVALFTFLSLGSSQVNASELTFKAGFNKLNIEIVPLSFQAKADVLGLNLEVDGSRAIILTGQAALLVADAADLALDTSAQAIILTGKSVYSLLDRPFSTVKNVAGTLIMTTNDIAQASVDLALDAVQSGAKVVVNTPKTMSQIAQNSVKALVYVAKNPVTFVTESTVKVYKTGTKVIGKTAKLVKGLLKFLGLGIFFN